MNEIARPQKCVIMRNGVEIWFDTDKADRLIEVFTSPNAPQFITYEGRLLNRADLVGVFLPPDIEDMTRRKNGEWKCRERGNWHGKGAKCDCQPILEWERNAAIMAAVDRCAESDGCRGGFVFNEVTKSMEPHTCIEQFFGRCA